MIIQGEGIKQLAVGCLYALLDRAIVDFPGSGAAQPSPFVLVRVAQRGLMTDQHKVYFPIKVPGRFWQEVVVPVLRDPYNQIRPRTTSTLLNADKQGWLESGEYDRIVEQLELALTQRMQATGYLMAPPPEPPPPKPPCGEPIVLPPVTPPPFPDPDGTLVWPDGHPRLVYPIVD